MTAPAWLNPAGGLRYHARALFGAGGWEPFQTALAAWLAGVELRSTRGVLVSPSAGYCIPDAFLSRFAALTVLEPDPIAGFLLLRRLRRLGIREVRVVRVDQLIAPLLEQRAGLAELLAADPELCVVFGNVLGQTTFLVGSAEFARFKSEFRARIIPLLSGRSWLSFHDRLSGELAPAFQAPFRAPARLDDAALLRDLYAGESAGATVELIDHDSGGFFPHSLPHSYFSWRIAGARYHLIEGVASSG
jgi:hypothetical protein